MRRKRAEDRPPPPRFRNMKITAKSRYALRILLDVAIHGGEGLRTIKQIAESQGISEKFISRIAVPLRRAGFLATTRGVNGGFRLARLPSKITLLAIVEAIDGPLALVHCLAHPGACRRQGSCAAEIAWGSVNEALAEALRRVTLQDVADDQRRFAQTAPQEPDYCI